MIRSVFILTIVCISVLSGIANPLYPNQFYLHNTGQSGGTVGIDINAEGAWQISGGHPNIVVAVIDKGVQKTHEDLQGIVLDGYTYGESNGDGTPLIADYHGTACAGIIAAIDNNIGIKGVAHGAKILSVNFVDGSNYSAIADCIEWAATRADIICLPIGISSNINDDGITNAINNAITNGRNGRGCTVVCGSGNNSTYHAIQYPANINGVITVGAIDNNGIIFPYSCRGLELDVVAPSGKVDNLGNVYTTDLMGNDGGSNTNYLYTFGGTSAACPQVAGVVALMLSVNPTLTVSQIRNILHETAVDLGTTGFDVNYGYGLVDAGAAVAAARDSLQVVTGGTIWFKKYNKTLVEAEWINNYPAINLPNNYEVHWRCSDGWTMETDSVTAICRITRPSTNYNPSGYLYADIYWNGVKVATATRNLSRDPLATYHQDACLFYNVNHPAIGYHTVAMPYSSVFVHQGCTVTMQASMFKQTDISTVGITPDYWHHDATTGYVYFRLPLGSGGIPFVVRVGDAASNPSYSVTFFTVSNNGNVLSLNPISGSSYEVRLNSFEDEELMATQKNSELATLRNIRPEWTLEVYDGNRAQQCFVTRVNGYSTILDVSGWVPGTYLLRAVVGDEVYSEKLLIR